ncbi:MAG: hypothetical protein APR63_05600 [Desulfuromonas sp. SDB]|nr:MAG: hypothetical protein APR63_05600 [Desulfuromonas sp. SDB]
MVRKIPIALIILMLLLPILSSVQGNKITRTGSLPQDSVITTSDPVDAGMDSLSAAFDTLGAALDSLKNTPGLGCCIGFCCLSLLIVVAIIVAIIVLIVKKG